MGLATARHPGVPDGALGELLGDIAADGYWEAIDLRARLHPDDIEPLRVQVMALLEGRSQRAVVQHRVRASEGWRWVETHAMVAEHDSKGQPLRLMGTLADIGERKRIEQDGERARELTEQASRAKSEFLANISHEVRTPLNAFMGLTRMLMDSPLNGDQSSWLALMDNSAHELLDLLNNLLDLSRIEAGQFDIENVRFDLHQALEQAIVPYAEQAGEQALDFRFELPPTLPQWVMGDAVRLRQVLNHLLSNALKFTPRGGRIEVRIQPIEPAGQAPKRLQLQVRDSGVGIAREHHATVFDAFTQADASTARPYGGSGLGLAICAQLARLMGGEIDLQSDPGEGSTFTLTLPLRELDQSPLSASAELQEVAQAGARYVGLVVLLAEDHPVNELMMRQLLLRLGCIVRVARGGVHAIAQWEQGGIDLVLMDVQMPGMSGLQATHEIRDIETRRKLPRTPIVAVTANAMPGDREACLAAGMDGYTAKPVSPQALIKEMDRVLKLDDGLAEPEQAPATPAPAPVTIPAPVVPSAVSGSRAAATHLEALDVEKLLRRLDGDEETLGDWPGHARRPGFAPERIAEGASDTRFGRGRGPRARPQGLAGQHDRRAWRAPGQGPGAGRPVGRLALVRARPALDAGRSAPDRPRAGGHPAGARPRPVRHQALASPRAQPEAFRRENTRQNAASCVVVKLMRMRVLGARAAWNSAPGAIR